MSFARRAAHAVLWLGTLCAFSVALVALGGRADERAAAFKCPPETPATIQSARIVDAKPSGSAAAIWVTPVVSKGAWPATLAVVPYRHQSAVDRFLCRSLYQRPPPVTSVV